MFIIENWLQSRKDRIRAWEEARDRWVNEDSNGWRNKRDYEVSHPKPVTDLGFIGRLASIIAISLCVVLLFAGFIREQVNKPDVPKKVTTNCGEFNKGDLVKIEAGDYADLTGRLIGGCEKNKDYQVKLDPSQRANLPNDGTNTEQEVGGKVIGVNSSSNLVVLEGVKK